MANLLVSDAVKTLNEACETYCSWYDTGNPRMEASDMAYHLVTSIRMAIRILEASDDPS